MNAKTYTTPEGIVRCTRCNADLVCNPCGDMPTECPRCHASLDYSSVDTVADEWICTDDDTAQYRRRVYNRCWAKRDDIVHELAQVNQYDDFFRIAHGFVYDSEIDADETNSLRAMYGWDEETVNCADFPALLAEAYFETHTSEYEIETPEKYTTFERAAKALAEFIGMNVCGLA